MCKLLYLKIKNFDLVVVVIVAVVVVAENVFWVGNKILNVIVSVPYVKLCPSYCCR